MKRKTKKLAKKVESSCKIPLYAAGGMLLVTWLLPLFLLVPGGGTGEAAELVLLESAAPVEKEPENAKESISSEAQSEPAPESKPEESAVSGEATLDSTLTLTAQLNGENQEMTMEEYLWGVIAAEMPAAFEQAALDAQAVAARTYTLYRMAHPSGNHPDADICGDSTCCQAWISREDRLELWSAKDRQANAEKITKAISDTDGIYLSYEGEPILAAFHAASAGSTKSALEVWGKDYPYLQEVDSPEDDSLVPNYYSTVKVDKADFAEVFSGVYPEADLSAENCEDWFGEETYDEAGLPVSIQIGGVEVDTGQVRTLFELRSASFTVECQGDTITFYVTGYGHGVGMSQYGANALAKEGKSWEEILAWYYAGAEEKLIGNDKQRT